MGCSTSTAAHEASQNLVDGPEKKRNKKKHFAVIPIQGRLAARRANCKATRTAPPTPQPARHVEAAPNPSEAEQTHLVPHGPTLLAGSSPAQLMAPAKDGLNQPLGAIMLDAPSLDVVALSPRQDAALDGEAPTSQLEASQPVAEAIGGRAEDELNEAAHQTPATGIVNLAGGWIDAVVPDDVLAPAISGWEVPDASWGCRGTSCGCPSCATVDAAIAPGSPNVSGIGVMNACCPSVRQHSIDEMCFCSMKVLDNRLAEAPCKPRPMEEYHEEAVAADETLHAFPMNPLTMPPVS